MGDAAVRNHALSLPGAAHLAIVDLLRIAADLPHIRELHPRFSMSEFVLLHEILFRVESLSAIRTRLR